MALTLAINLKSYKLATSANTRRQFGYRLLCYNLWQDWRAS